MQEEIGNTKSTVTCELCGLEFSRLQWTHLKHSHGLTMDEYIRMFPFSPLVCEDWCEEHSNDLSGREFTEEHLASLSEGNYKRWEDPVQREARSRLMTELWKTPSYVETTMDALNRLEPRDLDFRKEMSRSKNEFYSSAEGLEVRKRIADTNRKLWEDPEYVARQQKSRQTRPNFDESWLLYLLNENFTGEWTYTGDLSFMVGHRNPDFLHTSRKLVIELFGEYWHSLDPSDKTSEEATIQYYGESSYKCLVLWTDEIYSESFVVGKVKEFASGDN